MEMTREHLTQRIENAITEINENDARTNNDFIRECCKKHEVKESYIRKIADIRTKME